MTEENCHTEAWEADEEKDHPTNFLAKVFMALKSFIEWMESLVIFVSDMIYKTKRAEVRQLAAIPHPAEFEKYYNL